MATPFDMALVIGALGECSCKNFAGSSTLEVWCFSCHSLRTLREGGFVRQVDWGWVALW